tara:strand:- start:251 stop:409 length:159 start_codon:yes stop_codon:yes gene_type:complete
LNHLIVIGAISQGITPFRLRVEASHQLLQLINFVEKTEQIRFRHRLTRHHLH